MKLTSISKSVQRIAEAIESVINVDVTIVDNNLNRIAATGLYVNNIGDRLNDNTVFAYALKKGEKFIIENPREHEACSNCDDKQYCKEYAQVCCPIKVDEKIFGVIGLIAFEINQKTAILNNKDNLLEFLSRMSDLIAAKLIEESNTEQLNLMTRELEILLDSIDRGVISVDIHGNVLHYNSKAMEIFRLGHKNKNINNISRLLDVDVRSIIDNKLYIKNKGFNYNNNGVTVRGIYNVKPIIIDDEVVRLVFTFNKMNEIINVVNDVTSMNMEITFDDIIGRSSSVNMLKEYATKAAKSTSTVLIQGESGTGKELFARAIHYSSDRRKYPFIPINCAAIPENLLESELFGYEEGAFTGAKKGGKTGKFELANLGTVFLDEIGDMPIHLQTKLLRVLQDNLISRVGSNNFIPIDVRIIAATNKDLEKKVQEGEFRKDLYYRLNVIPLYILPLRERINDIPILAQKFLDRFNCKLNKNILGIEDNVIELFMCYSWPGNVRELENAMEYAVNMATGSIITINDLPKRIKFRDKDNDFQDTSDDIIPIFQLEKNEITKAIEKFGRTREGMEKAAKSLGISRSTIYRKIKQYGIT